MIMRNVHEFLTTSTNSIIHVNVNQTSVSAFVFVFCAMKVNDDYPVTYFEIQRQVLTTSTDIAN